MTGIGDRSLETPGDQFHGEHSLGGRYRLLLLLAWAAVSWERLWARVWKPVLVAAAFAATVLLDLFPWLPGWLHLVVLAGFVMVFALLLYRGLKGFQTVDKADVRRRLERDSGLAHRPLSGLADQPASTKDDLSLKIWLVHIRRLTDDTVNLTVRLPSPGLAARDPFAIRAVVLLALVIGGVAGYGEAGPRLARAFTIGSGADDHFSVEIWLTPPSYSRQPPVFLSNDSSIVPGKNAARIDIPAGTTLAARIAGHQSWYASGPMLEIGGRVIPLTPIGAARNDERESFQAETVLDGAGDGDVRLGVRANGSEVANWLLGVVPDRPPVAKFTGQPDQASRSRLTLAYEASDDYGVENLRLEMRLQNRMLLASDQVRISDFPMGGAPSSRQHIKRRSTHDLTADPWAGLPVELRLVARDGAGQEGASKRIKIVLPERSFSNEAARAVIEQRRRLALLKPGSRQKIEADIIVGLELIKEKPQAYDADTVVFLSLSVAQARLTHNREKGRNDSVMELLWDTAIRIEDGGLAVAERELKQTREDLRKALQEDANPADIDRLMDRVRQALDNYLLALGEKMRAEGGPDMAFNPMMRMLGADDLKGLLNKARELARTGATDAAAQMLSELDRILESIQGAMRGGKDMAAMNKALQQLTELLSRARHLAAAQQDLLDDTFAAANTERRESTKQADSAVAGQRALRRNLGQLMLDTDNLLGDIPPALGRADRDMMEAVDALGQRRLPDALGRQTRAVANVRQAVEDMSDKMAKMLAGASGLSLGNGAVGMMPGGRDPFGRLTGQGGLKPGGTVGIPERGQVQRSRQILDELRRRAGQNQRPKPERDYIDRLLRKF